VLVEVFIKQSLNAKDPVPTALVEEPTVTPFMVTDK
jgi:hypothetical protein